MKNSGCIYGMDDYRTLIAYLYGDTLHIYSSFQCVYMPLDENMLDEDGNIKEVLNSCTSILKDAKTVYIHPSCKIPRAVITQKYKKTLNPWLADAVVIPDENKYSIHECAIFVNENAKLALIIAKTYGEPTLQEHLSNKKVKKLIDITQIVSVPWSCTVSTESVLEADFDFYGKAVKVDKGSMYFLDILTNCIPQSKIVKESSVLKSLSTDDNKPTFENMTTIYEMLNSSDEAVVGAAMKALAAMDYINYPNSVILILQESYAKYRYNQSVNSSAVKYMLNNLIGNSVRKYPRILASRISEEDFNLFVKLSNHIHKDYSLDFIKGLSFMYVDTDMQMHPRIMRE